MYIIPFLKDPATGKEMVLCGRCRVSWEIKHDYELEEV